MLRLVEEYKTNPAQALATFMSLLKLVFLDVGLAIETYLAQRERSIRVQQEAFLLRKRSWPRRSPITQHGG